MSCVKLNRFHSIHRIITPRSTVYNATKELWHAHWVCIHMNSQTSHFIGHVEVVFTRMNLQSSQFSANGGCLDNPQVSLLDSISSQPIQFTCFVFIKPIIHLRNDREKFRERNERKKEEDGGWVTEKSRERERGREGEIKRERERNQEREREREIKREKEREKSREREREGGRARERESERERERERDYFWRIICSCIRVCIMICYYIRSRLYI